MAESSPTEQASGSAGSPAWLGPATWVALALGAAPRIWAGIEDHGMLWPDEIYQTLEQAHRFAFGWGIIPWEFRLGARSWVFPGLLGVFLRAVSYLGVKRSYGIVISAKLLMAAISVLGIELGRRIAQQLAGPVAGFVATVLIGGCPLLLFFGSRVMTETASGTVILAAVYLALIAEHRQPAMAGFLSALAIYFRYQNGLVALLLLIILAARRDWTAARRYAATATLFGIAGGLLDGITWDYPFQSFWKYVDYNLLSGQATKTFGANPPSYYLNLLESSVGATLGLLVVGGVASLRRSVAPAVLVGVFILAHFAIPHKELRFLLPIIPLGVALGAVGLTDLCASALPGWRWPVGLALAMGLAMGVKAANGRVWEIGRQGNDPIWHWGEDYFQEQWAASRKPDLCGLGLSGLEHEWTGGYSYLHRHVSIYLDGRHLAQTNYIVGAKDENLPDNWHVVDENGDYKLYRRDGSCEPDPDYLPYLN